MKKKFEVYFTDSIMGGAGRYLGREGVYMAENRKDAIKQSKHTDKLDLAARELLPFACDGMCYKCKYGKCKALV